MFLKLPPEVVCITFAPISLFKESHVPHLTSKPYHVPERKDGVGIFVNRTNGHQSSELKARDQDVPAIPVAAVWRTCEAEGCRMDVHMQEDGGVQ